MPDVSPPPSFAPGTPVAVTSSAAADPGEDVVITPVSPSMSPGGIPAVVGSPGEPTPADPVEVTAEVPDI